MGRLNLVEQDNAVRRLIADGKGWTEIGAEIGISRQHAYMIGRKLGLSLLPGVAEAKLAEGRSRRKVVAAAAPVRRLTATQPKGARL